MQKRLIPILLLILFEAVADYFATKRGTENAKLWIAFLAIFFYIVCNTFWLFALKDGVGLGKWNMIFAVGSSILAILMGVYLFNEHYSPIQIVWFCLGIVSLALVNME